MADKEPIAWVTRGGKHIPIFDNGPSEEEKQKERQINESKKQADAKNKKADTPKYTKRGVDDYVLGDPNKSGPKIHVQRGAKGRITGGGTYWYVKYGIKQVGDSYDTVTEAKKAGLTVYEEYKQKGIL